MNTSSALDSTVAALLAHGKGILAADESHGTIEKRFKALNVSSTEETRLQYREMLFSTPTLNEFVSGVILFDETIRQRTNGGLAMPEALRQSGLIPGIKVDKGTSALANFPGEKITLGLDGLRERLTEYRELGVRFTKWRAVIKIGEGIPTRTCIEANAEVLARFASLSQEAGLVPIVEPEVLMDGTHTLLRCEEVTLHTLQTVFTALARHHVVLEQMLLKTGMVLSGAECPEQANLETITEATLRGFRRSVPAAVPGIVFLSGGQSSLQATERLNAICLAGNAPWKLSFSYGRALQAPAMKKWKGSTDNIAAAQAALQLQAKNTSLATLGKYANQA